VALTRVEAQLYHGDASPIEALFHLRLDSAAGRWRAVLRRCRTDVPQYADARDLLPALL